MVLKRRREIVGDWSLANNELEKVLDAFYFVPRKIEQKGGVYKVYCQDGIYALKPSQAPYEKLMVLHGWLDQLRQSGYRHLLSWLPSQNGEVVVKTESGSWYATLWKYEENLKNDNHFSPVHLVHALATFHQKIKPLVESESELKKPVSTVAVDHWKKQKEFLDQTYEDWNKQELPSPFTKRFLSLKESMDQFFDFSIRGLERFVAKEEGVVPRHTLCHRRLHPKNVVYDEDNFYFIDFDHAQVDTPVRDLALMIRRFGRLSSEEGPEVLFETYNSQYPLKPIEKKLLAIYLSYPERLIKTVYQYRNQTRVAEEESHAVQRIEEEWNYYYQVQNLTKKLWKSERAQTENRETVQVRASKSGKRRKKSKSGRS